MKDSKLKVKPLKIIIMKTIDKVRKTVLKSFAVIIGFVLISFTVSAKDLRNSFTQNCTKNELALAKAHNRIEFQPASTNTTTFTNVTPYTGHLITESESMLELEEWMTNEDLFCTEQFPAKKKIISTANFVYLELEDPRLLLANWMFNLKYWSVKK